MVVVLSRFMGLDFLKKKEELAKELYSEFSKSMLSNIYSSEKLKLDNKSYEDSIVELNNSNVTLNGDLIDVGNRITKGQDYRDGLLKGKFTDIDSEISSLSPEKVETEITSLKNQKQSVVNQLKEIKVVEPSSYYHEDEHDNVKELYNETYKRSVEIDNKVTTLDELKNSVSGGIKCEHCGIELMNAAITQTKIAELAGFVIQQDEIKVLLQELSDKEKSFVKLKKEFDEYEKNKLIKEKYEISVESFDLKITGLNNKLEKYREVQDKIVENSKIDTLIIKAGLRLDELDAEKRSILTKIGNNKYQIESLEEKIENNVKTIKKISEESEKERIFKIYLEIFGKNGISKMIMKTMMPLINSELQRLLEDSCHFRLEIRINDKNEVDFIMIDNNTQVEKLMSSGSGYERTIASLALRAVLTKICSLPKPNIVVMDEIFGKVSNDNLELVGEFFSKIKEYFEKIFLITHNPLVTNWADNVIKIKKEENISYVSQ